MLLLSLLQAEEFTFCSKNATFHAVNVFKNQDFSPNYILEHGVVKRSRRAISVNGQCNPDTCPPGNCCSQYNYCGATADHCNALCQPAFSGTGSTCVASNVSTDGVCSVNGKVCPAGQCCNASNTCGTTTTDCGSTCQKTFSGTGAPCNLSGPQPSTDGVCGSAATKGSLCQGTFGNCCSKYNFCGSTADFCGLGCQKAFSSSAECVGLYPTFPNPPATTVKYTLTAPVLRCKNPKVVALTFDDGPSSNSNTVDTMNKLKASAIPGFFFLLGNRVYVDYAKSKTVLANGFQIGHHSFWHNSSPSFYATSGDAVFKQDMSATTNTIYKYLQKNPKYFRPPFGDYNAATMAVWGQLGLKTIGWSIDTQDANNVGAGKTVAQAQTLALDAIKAVLASEQVNVVYKGHIVLCHDTLNVCSGIIPQIKTLFTNKGYRFVTLNECLGDLSPYK